MDYNAISRAEKLAELYTKEQLQKSLAMSSFVRDDYNSKIIELAIRKKTPSELKY